MKFLDKVQVIENRKSYQKQNVVKNMIGTIIDAEIRENCFNVVFVDEKAIKDDILCPIKIKDLIVIEDRKCSDEKILEAIPKQNKSWWCKVEDGYILNLIGERKNKIPYKYD